jgi:hypothetical protein
MAITSDGAILVNAHALTNTDSLDAAIEIVKKSGLVVFVGVVVPQRMHRRLLKDIDNATADVVGRIGPHLVKGGRR